MIRPETKQAYDEFITGQSVSLILDRNLDTPLILEMYPNPEYDVVNSDPATITFYHKSFERVKELRRMFNKTDGVE